MSNILIQKIVIDHDDILNGLKENKVFKQKVLNNLTKEEKLSIILTIKEMIVETIENQVAEIDDVVNLHSSELS